MRKTLAAVLIGAVIFGSPASGLRIALAETEAQSGGVERVNVENLRLGSESSPSQPQDLKADFNEGVEGVEDFSTRAGEL